MAGFSEFFMGTPGKMMQAQRFNPQQQGALGQMLAQSMGGLGGDQFDFAPIEQQARQGFAQQTVPSLAERFTSMGSGGGQRSSAFAGSLGQAASGLESNLASMRSQYGLQQQQNLMRMLQMALQPQFENLYMPSSQGFLGSMMGSAGQGMGQGIASLLPLLFGLQGA